MYFLSSSCYYFESQSSVNQYSIGLIFCAPSDNKIALLSLTAYSQIDELLVAGTFILL